MKIENINKPPRYRKQLKTITIEIATCPVCNQDLQVTFERDVMSEDDYKCNTEGCGYVWEQLIL